MKKEKQKVPMKTKVMSLILLFIMVASVAGFALSMAGGNSNIGSSTGDQNVPDNLPIQQVEYQGQEVWVAIKNSEVFVFETIDSFIGNSNAEETATRIQLQRQVYIYVEPDFVSNEAVFLLERALGALGINYQEISDRQCTANTIIFSNDMADEGSDCIVFNANNQSEAFSKAQNIIYFLVRD